MIDLHIHTDNSDGEFSVIEILKKANKLGLTIISITDHDNINAYQELNSINIKDYYEGQIIPGVELEFVYNGKLCDMLGYGVSIKQLMTSELIQNGLIHSTISKETRILNYLKSVCKSLGIKYSLDLSILKANYMANDVLVDDILKNPDNKMKLNELGIVDRSTFYRKHICNVTSPFYIDKVSGKENIDIFYVTSLIHDCGGLCFLAHPFVYQLSDTKEFLDNIVSLNLIDGIECEHRKHNEDQIKFLHSYCDNHGLLKSGGSDFHIESNCLGYANQGKHELNESLIKKWKDDVIAFNDIKNRIKTTK